ncbi:MAG: cyclophilin-like fold protein [Pseudomonadota bacterium]
MPTNILRSRPKPAAKPAGQPRAAGASQRVVLLTAGRVRIRIALLETATAERIWRALPLYSTAETWGESVHFELPVESGRERGARMIAEPGEVFYWSEDDRVVIGYGPTPISGAGEIRLPRPCNLLARALDDVTVLRAVRPGEKVSLEAVQGQG